jgi:Ni/Co efflux regulator RcnB
MTNTKNTVLAAAVGLALAGLLAVGPALADKGGKGHDKGGDKHDRSEQRDDRDHGAKNHGNKHAEKSAHVDRFDDPHRGYVRDYYAREYRAGRCPPGLAKKHNGCMPPGQAKKWDVGQPLPRDVRYYDVPAPLVMQLGQPAPGYRYVRVDDNILLLATGTRMIVDSIRGFGRS